MHAGKTIPHLDSNFGPQKQYHITPRRNVSENALYYHAVAFLPIFVIAINFFYQTYINPLKTLLTVHSQNLRDQSLSRKMSQQVQPGTRIYFYLN